MINLNAAVKGNVEFQYFRDGALWYATEEGEIFPVPVEDAASSTFNRVEKGMLLMRWMRKWNESGGDGEMRYSEEEKSEEKSKIR
jgi:hypothetical protein